MIGVNTAFNISLLPVSGILGILAFIGVLVILLS